MTHNYSDYLAQRVCRILSVIIGPTVLYCTTTYQVDGKLQDQRDVSTSS